MVSSHAGVSDWPKPGCSGTITSNFFASLAMAGSQMPAPPPPCRNKSGAPVPPRTRRMRQSPIMIGWSVWSAMLSPSLPAARPPRGNSTPRMPPTYTLICRVDRGRGRVPTRDTVAARAHAPGGDVMYAPAGVKTDNDYPIPDRMKAWVLGDPGELSLTDKPVPVPKKAEVLVRIDAVAICATDLEIIYHGPPASILGGMPHNKNFTPGHEYMGTVVALGPGVDEYRIGQRVTVEIHAGCGQCKRCREGMYTSCHNYGLNYGDVDKGHRANGFTTDGGFCEYQVNNINTLVAIPD